MQIGERAVTAKVHLHGGQNRLRQMILHVAEQCSGARYFGAVKLNKIIWKADFDAFVNRRVPVTGREYLKQQFGPALREMIPVQSDMLRDGLIRFEERDFGDNIVERRTIALAQANLSYFTADDLRFVTSSIEHYWEKTGTESSDESHGIAWKSRALGQTMPYESALLSDRTPSIEQFKRLRKVVADRELMTE